MIKIKIGEDERLISDIDAQWINQQINGRRADGQTVCVRVSILDGDINLMLSTPTCRDRYSGSTKQLSNREKEVIELWKQRRLDSSDFSSGNIIAFLKQLERLI